MRVAHGGENPATPAPLVVTALGDSLTAGYNLPQDQAFPVQLEAALRARGHAVRVVNAGVSGDTTAGGRARLDWLLADAPDAVIVALGGNDGLRGIDPAATRANLAAVLTRLDEAGIPVLLAGMRAPPNLGRPYTEAFDALYPDLARAHGAILYPFFLEGVIQDPTVLQPDGLHPTAAGVARMVTGILPDVAALLDRARDRARIRGEAGAGAGAGAEAGR